MSALKAMRIESVAGVLAVFKEKALESVMESLGSDTSSPDILTTLKDQFLTNTTTDTVKKLHSEIIEEVGTLAHGLIHTRRHHKTRQQCHGFSKERFFNDRLLVGTPPVAERVGPSPQTEMQALTEARTTATVRIDTAAEGRRQRRDARAAERARIATATIPEIQPDEARTDGVSADALIDGGGLFQSITGLPEVQRGPVDATEDSKPGDQPGAGALCHVINVTK